MKVKNSRRVWAHRGLLSGFGYESGVLIAASVSYIEAVFAKHASYSIGMAAAGSTVFLLAAIVTAFSHEKRAAYFGTP